MVKKKPAPKPKPRPRPKDDCPEDRDCGECVWEYNEQMQMYLMSSPCPDSNCVCDEPPIGHRPPTPCYDPSRAMTDDEISRHELTGSGYIVRLRQRFLRRAGYPDGGICQFSMKFRDGIDGIKGKVYGTCDENPLYPIWQIAVVRVPYMMRETIEWIFHGRYGPQPVRVNHYPEVKLHRFVDGVITDASEWREILVQELANGRGANGRLMISNDRSTIFAVVYTLNRHG